MLYKNQILEHKPSGHRWRVLQLDETGEGVWLFNIEERLAVPEWKAINEVKDVNTFAEVERPLHPSKIKFSKASKARREQAHSWIAPLIATSEIYEPSKRSAMVLARADEVDCSPQTLYNYLRAWWRNGQNVQALTSQFHRCGNIAGKTGKRGRPCKFGTPTYQLTSADLSIIEKTVKDVFLKSRLATLEGSFQTMLETHYGYIDGEGRLIIKLLGERPSLGQFRYHAKKHLPVELLLRSKKGDATFELEDRPVLGSLRHATFTVADVYEIDSTVADVLLVHENDRSKIIGKPALYMVRDRKSNLVVGFYVGLEGSCWIAAMQAILSISEDKKSLCQRHGVAYIAADWPAHGVMPKEFLGDRGSEMLGNDSDSIADGLELTITNLPTRRADWKPHVECGFKQAHKDMRGEIPGYTPPEDSGKRQKEDYSKDASLTLKEFRKVVLEHIIKHNNSPIRNYKLAPQYVLEGMQPTPINIWNAEIRDRAGLPTVYHEAEVRLALLPRAKAVVTREGIQLGDCFYSAPEAMDKGWFVVAGRGRFEVDVSYDLRLVDTIYVHDESHPEQYFEAHLLDKCSHFRGLSHREVEALGFLAKQIRHHGEELYRQRKADFHQNIAPTVSAAKAATKAASKGVSRSARKKDTRPARDDARRLERQEAFAQTSPSSSPASQATVIAIPTNPNNASAASTPAGTQSKSRQDKYKELMNGRT